MISVRYVYVYVYAHVCLNYICNTQNRDCYPFLIFFVCLQGRLHEYRVDMKGQEDKWDWDARC